LHCIHDQDPDLAALCLRGDGKCCESLSPLSPPLSGCVCGATASPASPCQASKSSSSDAPDMETPASDEEENESRVERL
jgi:hypothetical protein